MICEMCLFQNPADAERCLCCQRMTFAKSKRPTGVAEDRSARPTRTHRETIRDEDTSVDWNCFEPPAEAPHAGGSSRLAFQV